MPEWVICQDCLTPFSLERICGHDLLGSKGDQSAGNTFRLIRAMHDKSKDALPLADFIPKDRTLDECRPSESRMPSAPVAVDQATNISLGWREDEDDPKWGRPGRRQDAR